MPALSLKAEGIAVKVYHVMKGEAWAASAPKQLNFIFPQP